MGIVTPGMMEAEFEKSIQAQRKEQDIFLKIQKVRIQNDWGHTLLPSNLREQAGWQLNDKLTAMVNISAKTVTFRKSSNGEYEALEIGTVRLDETLRKKLGWRVGDELTVAYDADAGMIIYAK